jgi:hypothetical protein
MPKGPIARGGERGARLPPFADQRRQRIRQQLVVNTIKDDGQRDPEHEQLLVAAPAPLINQLSGIDATRAGCRIVNHCCLCR